MGEEAREVLVMYDVRGIQKYIFNTAKVKDAIGASYIVENIIEDALKYATDVLKVENLNLLWKNDEGPIVYDGSVQYDVQVLYIGGGNAYVVFRNRELCIDVNKVMAKYIIEKTYSLHLAVAIVEKTDDYAQDYRCIMKKMDVTKANMIMSKPLGKLPVVKLDEQTTEIEHILKLVAEKEKRNQIDSKVKIFDNYITEKGVDSTIAVVHMDGNNMGLRIREQIKNVHDYNVAVNKMRQISFNISDSYKKVFKEMADLFNQDEKMNILPILVAGDDITYVCNGRKALDTVKYYVENISKCSMTGASDEESLKTYGFSVCAGVAYINSHFPFSVAYEVAEECCASAKKEAKNKENCVDGRVGNWVDYQIVKSIHAKKIEDLRDRELSNGNDEILYRRPYYIPTDSHQISAGEKALDRLLQYVADFKSERVPKSFLKQIRNAYPLGNLQVEVLMDFLKSRGHNMPDGTYEMYEKTDSKQVAKWYDALEIMDYIGEEK